METGQVEHTHPEVKRVTTSSMQARKEKLCEIVGQPELLSPEQTAQLHCFLGENHDAFSLDPHERGETDLLTMVIEPQEVFLGAVEPQDVSAEEELELESAVDVPESTPRNQDRYSLRRKVRSRSSLSEEGVV